MKTGCAIAPLPAFKNSLGNYETEKMREVKKKENKKLNQIDHQFSSWSIQNVPNITPPKIVLETSGNFLSPLHRYSSHLNHDGLLCNMLVTLDFCSGC